MARGGYTLARRMCCVAVCAVCQSSLSQLSSSPSKTCARGQVKWSAATVQCGRRQTSDRIFDTLRCPRPPRSSRESAGAWPGQWGEVSCVIWVDAGRMLGHHVPWTAWALGTAKLAKADRLETLQPVPRRQSDNGNGQRAINTCIILT